MNFNSLALLFLILLTVGCGVKSDPIPPRGTELPSYVDKFLDAQEKTNDEKENGKKADQP